MLPETLPPLPQAELPHNLTLAHNAITDIYQYALRVLNQDQMDPIQLKFHLAAVKGDAIPLLLAVGNRTGIPPGASDHTRTHTRWGLTPISQGTGKYTG
ncbi:hypothetical protein OG21DRAFT_397958 [Imleria badia]|nr:hypothetical protein OG21DRAFT_397958 [Imleria badia]